MTWRRNDEFSSIQFAVGTQYVKKLSLKSIRFYENRSTSKALLKKGGRDRDLIFSLHIYLYDENVLLKSNFKIRFKCSKWPYVGFRSENSRESWWLVSLRRSHGSDGHLGLGNSSELTTPQEDFFERVEQRASKRAADIPKGGTFGWWLLLDCSDSSATREWFAGCGARKKNAVVASCAPSPASSSFRPAIEESHLASRWPHGRTWSFCVTTSYHANRVGAHLLSWVTFAANIPILENLLED